MATTHREGLSTMMSGIERRMGLITITGDVGTGKTTLIYTLLKDLGGRLRTVFIFNPRLTFRQLVKSILLDLKVPVARENTFTLLQKFKEFLRERLDEDETVVIIIDEAHQLSARVLNDLAWFLEEDYPALKLLQILLVGQSELEPKLDSEELRLLKKKITVQYRLLHWSAGEAKECAAHRLKVVGSSSSKVFTPEAVDLICTFSKGIPRIINKICDAALYAGYDSSTPRIDVQIVRDVIAREELAYEEEEPFPEEDIVEKEETLTQEVTAREDVSHEREAPPEEALTPEEKLPGAPEAIGEMEISSHPQEKGLQRARSLFKKIGTGALSLGRGAVFALFHRPEGRKS